MNLKKIIYFTVLIVLSFINTIQATVYYVNATTGNDNNSGSENLPWKTIQKAANTLEAGDTVYIKAGTYTPIKKIELLNSGTDGKYINYLAHPGDEHLVVVDGRNLVLDNWFGIFAVISKDYIKISGLKVINSSYAGFYIDKSTNILIEKNDTYQTLSSGISVWDSDLVVVDNNNVSRACWPTGGKQECISIVTSNRVIVKNNLVHDGGSIDFKDGCTNGVIYNNTIHNIASVGIYIDAYETDQSNIHVFKNKVYNIFGVGISAASEEGGSLENVIVSRNIVYNCDDRAMVVHWTNKPNYLIKNIYVQHNTFYNNGEGLDVGVHASGKNINIINNIFSKNLIYQMQNSSTDLNTKQLHLRNNLLEGVNPSWALFGDDYILDNPKFIDISTNDFQLQSSSPAINKGELLTKTINSGTGKVIKLVDAGFFTNGYGISEGDLITIERQTQQFKIVAIDYINNTIALDKITSWNVGDGVSLAYNANMPDVGAYESGNSLGLFSNTIKKLVLYPNPTKGIVHISDDYMNDSYQIISLNGSILKKGKINSVKINVAGIDSGVYILKIINTTSNRILISRLIKE